MAALSIVIGVKNYTSWSMRAWLALKRTGQPFEEATVYWGAPGFRERLKALSPSGRMPVLRHGERVIWDSLAIGEYLAETFPEAGLWPDDRQARAMARAAACEMHGGFPALRRHMRMNIRKRLPGKGWGPGVAEDVDRIVRLWLDCRARFGRGGPYLFGRFTNADAVYAPVVTRFRTYAVPLPPAAQAYADAVWNTPEVRAWVLGALRETHVIPDSEL